MKETAFRLSIQFDEKSGKAKFSPKATITIPSSEYLTLINVIDRAHKCFESEEATVKEGSWETFIFKYSNSAVFITF